MVRRSAAWFLIGIFLLSGCVASQDTAGDMQQDSGQEMVTSPEDENENGEMNMTSANRQIRVTAEDVGAIIFELNESKAASDLYGQLPLSVEIEDFSDNEKIFYPEELDTSYTPLAEMEIGEPLTLQEALYETGTDPEDYRNLEQRILPETLLRLGADEVTAAAVPVEIDGWPYLFCPQAVSYGGRWYLLSLNSELARSGAYGLVPLFGA